jgi:hypothetical protein
VVPSHVVTPVIMHAAPHHATVIIGSAGRVVDSYYALTVTSMACFVQEAGPVDSWPRDHGAWRSILRHDSINHSSGAHWQWLSRHVTEGFTAAPARMSSEDVRRRALGGGTCIAQDVTNSINELNIDFLVGCLAA